ncbi:hypothetical protein D3C87_1236510 [compost metagenome]
MQVTPQIINTATISLEAAQALLAEARRICAARGFAATIAITDAGGHLRAFERADTAPFLTVGVASDKAWTAASFGLTTHRWNQHMADPTVAALANHPRMTPVGGGAPIVHEGRLLGGIGISGGTSVQDHEAAEEALRNTGFL